MKIDPYSTTAAFRALVYDSVILASETRRAKIKKSMFDRRALQKECGVSVVMSETLGEVQLHDASPWPEEEFIIFHRGNSSGYEVLFKRLRDTFAHGHFGVDSQGRIVFRHRYKGREDMENTRLFGHLKAASLKRLVAFLEAPASGR